MPRTAIISFRRHGSQTWELLAGQDVPIQEQLVEFRRLRALSEHEAFAEAEYWERDGGVRAFTKFTDPKAAKKAAADKLAADAAAAQSADITDPVSSEADPAATTPSAGELTAAAPAPQTQEPVQPPASGSSPAAKPKRAR